MKKIILILAIFVLSINGVFAKNVKFAQVTDVYYKNSSPSLVKIIKDINKTPDIDFIVFTGNNIGKASQSNLKRFLNDAKKLKKPFYVVLGNKDVSKTNDLEKSTYMKIVSRYSHCNPHKTNYSFKKGGIVFLVVDGSKELIPSANGFYNKETIDWVDKELTKNAKSKVIILQHFPLANKPDNEFFYTYNTLEYLQMLSKHTNVLAIISGHYNKNDEIIYNGVNHITTPRAENGYYKIIDIDISNDNTVYTLLKEVK